MTNPQGVKVNLSTAQKTVNTGASMESGKHKQKQFIQVKMPTVRISVKEK